MECTLRNQLEEEDPRGVPEPSTGHSRGNCPVPALARGHIIILENKQGRAASTRGLREKKGEGMLEINPLIPLQTEGGGGRSEERRWNSSSTALMVTTP